MSRDRPSPPSSPEDLPPHLRKRLEKLVPSLIKLGLCRIHSAESESDGAEEARVDCLDRLDLCRAVCCSYRFALTEGEARSGKIAWDREKPYCIALGENGYCFHHDAVTRRCRIWEDRPLRCRRYDCRRESSIWESERSVAADTFAHLPRE